MFTASQLMRMTPADISLWMRETDNLDALWLLSLERETRSQ